MLFQSFTFDVDADAGGGAGDGTYLQVILRDDDDVDELEPFAGDDPSRLAQRRTPFTRRRTTSGPGTAGRLGRR